MSLTVIEPGLSSSIVDAGRPRTRSLGVPVGGAADRRSLMLGNALVGNAPFAPGLEITLKGPRLRADTDIGCVLVGAPFDAFRDGYPLTIGQTFTLRAGEELRIGGTRTGARAYLCVVGGFWQRTILSSCSALTTVQAGECLACAASTIHTRSIEGEIFAATNPVLAVVDGLQRTWFDESEFYEREFTVTPACDRMGLRLKGNPLTMPDREMISEAVCPGAVQVTRDGQCIVLGVDGQTIGGYPKIAQVIQADLDALGQLRPGQTLRFRKVTLEEATARHRQAQRLLRRQANRIRLSLDAFPAERRFPTA